MKMEREGADDLLDLADELLGEPDYDYVPGWCKECDQEVTISTDERPFGMAESCDEHWPLSEVGT